MNHSEELYHYGVKGMKWGIRKDRRSTKELRSTASAEKLKNSESIVERGLVNRKGNIRSRGMLIGRRFVENTAIGMGSTAASIALNAIGASTLGNLVGRAGGIATSMNTGRAIVEQIMYRTALINKQQQQQQQQQRQQQELINQQETGRQFMQNNQMFMNRSMSYTMTSGTNPFMFG